jgi:hypothetical protein
MERERAREIGWRWGWKYYMLRDPALERSHRVRIGVRLLHLPFLRFHLLRFAPVLPPIARSLLTFSSLLLSSLELTDTQVYEP